MSERVTQIEAAFDDWIEAKFGPEQSGVSPEAYQWMWEAWWDSAVRAADIAERTYEGSSTSGCYCESPSTGTSYFGENSARAIME